MTETNATNESLYSGCREPGNARSLMGAKSERKRNFENGILTDDPALVNPLVEQFDSVWRGDFCRECGRREHCPDPVV